MTRVVSTNIGPEVGFEGALRTDPFIHLGFRGFWLTSAIRQLFELQVCNEFCLGRRSQ